MATGLISAAAPARQARVLMPLPDSDFDTTEAAVTWSYLTRAGHQVIFATELGRDGPTPQCDPLLLGRCFALLGLGAEREAVECYERLLTDPSFNAPIAYSEIQPDEYHGLVCAGGHAPGMRQYLGSEELQAKLREFWELKPERPVAAICHGPLVLARAGVLQGVRSTALPKHMERAAFFLTAACLGRYYRTYDDYVADEMIANGVEWESGPSSGCCGLAPPVKGTPTDDTHAFILEDGRYLSARWPGDVYLFAKRLCELLVDTA
eukprot:TRINITY_DN19542_c0_g1_i2.p1 TRINITY_DN19542_c0_g1~~TRINITY_DN19542_c0_g1_i2.p1  ORF type:complete len:265 (+),score=38.29 TRINITY_DN19542_c0_g1_i2:177-971(+)